MSKVTFEFTDERFVVTGASSGMGREVALALARAGAEVLAIGRNEARLAEVQSQAPNRIFSVRLDINDGKALEDAFSWFVKAHGKLNGGVHAAGLSDITPLRRGNTEQSRKIMETSFWAGMDFLRLVTKSNFGAQKTSTVVFSSVCAHSCEKGMFAYAASKAALESGIRAAAKEIASKGHRVNAIVPGWVQSPMLEQAGKLADIDTFLGRHLLGAGKPEDITDIVLFLLSDASRWMTGSSVAVDGGYLA